MFTKCRKMSSHKKYVMTYMSPISQETSTIMRLLEQTNKEFRATNKMMKKTIRSKTFALSANLLKLKQSISKQIQNQGKTDNMKVSPAAEPEAKVRRSPSPPSRAASIAQLSRHHSNASVATEPPSRAASIAPLSRHPSNASVVSRPPSRESTPPSQIARTPSKRGVKDNNNLNGNKKQKQSNVTGGVRTPPNSPAGQDTTQTPLSDAPTAQAPSRDLKASTALKIWHYFDSRHDFNPYKGFEFFSLQEDDFNNELKNVTQNNKAFLWNLFSIKSKSENYQISRLLEKTKMDYKDMHLVENVIYVRIYPNKDDANKFLLMKNDPINSPDPKTTLRSFVFLNPNNTDNKFLIDIKLLKGGMTSTSFDNFIENFFGKNNFAYPLEKLWDPAPSSEEHMEPVCRMPNEENTRERIKKTFNERSDDDNKKAFRNLTQEYFNLSYDCNGNAYNGFIFYIIKKNFKNKITEGTNFVNNIKSDYKFLINHIKSHFDFDILLHDNYLACRMKISGFSIPNIKNTLWLMFKEGKKLETFLKDENAIRNFRNKSFKSSKSEDAKSATDRTAKAPSKPVRNEDVQTLILLFLSHLASLNGDISKKVLLDLKKSGDWSLASYCHEINHSKDELGKERGKVRVFISGDNFTAFYGILRNVPTIFSSETDKLQGVDYNQLSIYTGDMKIDYDYFKNIILSYLENDIHLKALKVFFSDKGTKSLKKQKKPSTSAPMRAAKSRSYKRGMEHQYEQTRSVIIYLLSKYSDGPENFEEIFDSFVSINTTEHRIYTILSLYLKLLEYYLHDIFKIPETIKLKFIAEIFKNKVTSMISISQKDENACMKMMIEFKHAIDYAFDLVYFIYLFHVDKRILYILKEYTYNTIQVFLNTKRFLKLGGGRNTRSAQPTHKNQYNMEGDWLKNIIESRYNVDKSKDGLLTLLQVKISLLLTDSRKLIENVNHTVVRICRDVVSKIKSNETYNFINDSNINGFIATNIVKQVQESLKIDLIKDMKMMSLTVEETNSIHQEIPIISNQAAQVHISEYVLATFLSIRRDLETIYDIHKETMLTEYNSMYPNNQLADNATGYNTLKYNIFKSSKFDELKQELEEMNSTIGKLSDVYTNTPMEVEKIEKEGPLSTSI